MPASRQVAASSRIRFCIAIAIFDAGERVLLDALALRIAEEDHDRVAHVLVDGGAMVERDLRHLGQIAG